MSKIIKINYLIFAIIFTITFYQLYFTGYTTLDDVNLGMVIESSGGVFSAAHYEAAGLGRFMILLAFPVAKIPYLIDMEVWRFFIKITSFVILFVSLHKMTTSLFREVKLSLLILIMVMGIMQNGWDHNLMTSYPLVFNLYATCFFISISLFIYSINTKKLSGAIWASIFYFLSLGTEIFVPFVLAFPVIAALMPSSEMPDNGALTRIRHRVNFQIPLYISFAIYLTIYLLWRYYYAQSHSYDGNSIDGNSFFGFLNVIYYYGINGFPILSFENFSEKFNSITKQNTAILVLSLIKSLMGTYIIHSLTSSDLSKKYSLKFIYTAIAISITSAFLINVLLALTSKYQGWVLIGNSRSFTYTFFSMIFFSISLSFALILVEKIKFRLGGYLCELIKLLFISIIFSTIFVVQINNEYYFNEQRRSSAKWIIIDDFIREPDFKNIPDNSVIIAPSLIKNTYGIVKPDAQYWGRYIKSKTGRNIEFVDDGCDLKKPCYFLLYTQAIHAHEQYLIFSKVEPTSPSVSNSFVFYSTEDMGMRVISGHFFNINNKNSQNFYIDKEAISNASGNSIFSVKFQIKRGQSINFKFHEESPINLDKINISYSNDPFDLKSFKYLFGSGFYQLENNGSETWRWAESNAIIEINNLKKTPISLKMKGDINTFKERKSLEFSISNIPIGVVNSFPDNWNEFSINLTVPPGRSFVSINDLQFFDLSVDAAGRPLSFRIRNFNILMNKIN